MRNKFTKNQIFDRGGYLEMALYNNKSQVIAYTRFNKKYLKLVKPYKWSFDQGYVRHTASGLHFHNIIKPCPKKRVIDHKNGNGLDNRSKNLRIATYQQNMMNQKIQTRKKSSKYKGVCLVHGKYWQVAIRWSGKKLQVGSFKTEQEAAKAYNKASKKYYGKFARLNPI